MLLGSSDLMTGFRTGGEAREVPPLCINGKGMGRAPGVWLSRPVSFDDSGVESGSASFCTTAKGCSTDRAAVTGVSPQGTPVILLGVVSTVFCGIAEFIWVWIIPLTSSVAGVGAIEEVGAVGCSGIVDADPCEPVERF